MVALDLKESKKMNLWRFMFALSEERDKKVTLHKTGSNACTTHTKREETSKNPT